jgi:hypothetical protein
MLSCVSAGLSLPGQIKRFNILTRHFLFTYLLGLPVEMQFLSAAKRQFIKVQY